MARITFLAILLTVSIGGSFAQTTVPGETPSPYMTYNAFAEILIPVLGLEAGLPPDLANLPAETAFRLETALLSGNGLPYFTQIDRSQFVTRGFLADVLFEIVRRTMGIYSDTTAGKIALLAQNNMLMPGGVGDVLTREEILTALNNPVLTQAIAAFYSLPPFLGTGVNNNVNDPFGAYRVKNVTEQPSSMIMPSGRR